MIPATGRGKNFWQSSWLLSEILTLFPQNLTSKGRQSANKTIVERHICIKKRFKQDNELKNKREKRY